MDLRPLDDYRQEHPFYGRGDNENGAFSVPGPCGERLFVIASAGEGWEHVSVSTKRRTPNWREMEFIKKRTLGDVVAFQLHLPEADHISVHPHCLHIWRPTGEAIPLPPKWMVG